MAPPSQLAIATSAVNRLVKEEASYHKELEQQQARIEKLKQASSDEENAEWNLKQEVRGSNQSLSGQNIDNVQNRALDETKAMFPQLRNRIQESLAKLEHQLEQGEQNSPEETSKAKEAVASAKNAINESS
ncbi:putative tubulin-specific chaperone Rbl2 [Aureobasidium namibiae CBS 147.97]|uniref:Tubulin-specific chaperone A n=1 Tax=Aureobasidium namibiae CBS 147.97 TaxID=1043004 RepID=A0A074WJC7_9PEZI|nr:putative tubulin-specific chaperone Rbl2 [Aureobasidium namibiae CBS 147.97]KEQ73240.1 putative tubulin-specific chaperone Rbl2 [Aureobasidium namibiae CBS 147.97]